MGSRPGQYASSYEYEDEDLSNLDFIKEDNVFEEDDMFEEDDVFEEDYPAVVTNKVMSPCPLFLKKLV